MPEMLEFPMQKENISFFLDSDDYIENDMFEYMYTRIKDSGADMATCGLYEVYKDRIETQKEEVDFVCTGEDGFSAVSSKCGSTYTQCFRCQ